MADHKLWRVWSKTQEAPVYIASPLWYSAREIAHTHLGLDNVDRLEEVEDVREVAGENVVTYQAGAITETRGQDFFRDRWEGDPRKR